MAQDQFGPGNKIFMNSLRYCSCASPRTSKARTRKSYAVFPDFDQTSHAALPQQICWSENVLEGRRINIYMYKWEGWVGVWSSYLWRLVVESDLECVSPGASAASLPRVVRWWQRRRWCCCYYSSPAEGGQSHRGTGSGMETGQSRTSAQTLRSWFHPRRAVWTPATKRKERMWWGRWLGFPCDTTTICP